MKTVELREHFSYFTEAAKLQMLNDVVGIHTHLSPNIVSTATGCSFKQAMQILWLLFELYLADVFLLVYLKDDPEVSIARRRLLQGFPTFPLTYDFGAKAVLSEDEVLYGFEFVLANDSIVFTSAKSHDGK